MPRIPKWLGDAMEKVSGKYYHSVRVTHTAYLNEKLKLVRMEGDLFSTSFTAGNVVEFRVTDQDYRHYTPSRFDKEAGVCEVIFYTHHKGAGSGWAEALTVGDELKLIGPGGKLHYVPTQRNHFVFGDETSVGWMQCMEAAIERNGHHIFGLLEVKPGYNGWERFINKNIRITEASYLDAAGPAIEVVKNWEDHFPVLMEETFFYLTGRAKSIQVLRKTLIKKGVSSSRIKSEPYWAEGKSGL